MSDMPRQTPFTLPALHAGNPEISMAPLIDVVFLLLIFFMVTTVFPENRGFVIERPESRQSEPLAVEKLTFLLTKDGEVVFGNVTVTTADVERLVRERKARVPDVAVVLQVDRRATTDILVKVMDACKAGGVKQLGIATDAIEPRT